MIKMEFKPRTQKEIIDFNKKMSNEFMWFSNEELQYLEWETCVKYGIEKKIKEEYRGDNFPTAPYTKEHVIEQMKDYVEFAVEKWEGQRGLSVQRANHHFHTWCWLLGEEYFDKYITNGNQNLPDFYRQFDDIK